MTILLLVALLLFRLGTCQSQSDCKTSALAAANSYRSLHSVPVMSWDENLAQSAQVTADKLAAQSCEESPQSWTPPSTSLPVEGLAASFFSNASPSSFAQMDTADPCSAGIRTMYSWKDMYTFTSNPFTDNFLLTGARDGLTYNFVRLVWKGTRSIGCAVSDGTSKGSLCQVVFCYTPKINIPAGADVNQVYLDNIRQVNSASRVVVPEPSPRSKPRNLGAIIGAAVGGSALLVAVVGALVWWRRRRSQHTPADTLLADDVELSSPPLPPVSKAKPLELGYQWVSQKAEGRSFLQAGVNDVQLDTQKQWLPQGWTSPVIQLTSEQVQDQIQLLSDMPMGSGACGHVYKCVWESRFPGALLAAKILPNTAKYYDLALQSFKHETNILKAINHPNIVRIYGFCLDQPTVCIIMELLDFSVDRLVSSSSWLAGKLTSSTGVSTPITTDISNSQAGTAQITGLADGSVVVSVIEPSSSMTMKRVLRVAIDVAAGLEHLHADPGQRQSPAMSTQVASASQEDTLALPLPEQIGVVIHRDIKPDNMLVNAVGRTKLCDFGISRETLGTVLQTRHEGAGTDRYMAPELLVYRNNSANSGVVGKKVDIYSLGIVLYELVSHRAITAREAQQVPSGVRPSLITKSDPEAVQERLGELECSEEVLKRVEGIITRCWHHLPNKRPTAAELRQALMEVQDSLAGQTGLTGQL